MTKHAKGRAVAELSRPAPLRRTSSSQRILSAGLATATCVGVVGLLGVRMVEANAQEEYDEYESSAPVLLTPDAAAVATPTTSTGLTQADLDAYASALAAEKQRLDAYRADLVKAGKKLNRQAAKVAAAAGAAVTRPAAAVAAPAAGTQPKAAKPAKPAKASSPQAAAPAAPAAAPVVPEAPKAAPAPKPAPALQKAPAPKPAAPQSNSKGS